MPKIHEKETISELPVKPRRTRGTYSYKARNRFAATVIAVTSLIGLGYTFLPTTDKVRKYISDNWKEEGEFHKKRRESLAPFNEDFSLQSSTKGPSILAENDSIAIRNALALLDPLSVKSDQ